MNSSRTYFAFIFFGILTPLMLLFGGTMGSITVSAQNDITPTPTDYNPAPLSPEEMDLPDYAAEAEPLQLDTRIEGTLTGEQLRRVYSYAGHSGDILSLDVSFDDPRLFLDIVTDPIEFPNYHSHILATQEGIRYMGGGVEIDQDKTIWVVIYNESRREVHYTLEVNLEPKASSIGYDETLRDTLVPDSDYDYTNSYLFEGRQGDILDIAVQADFDTELAFSAETYDFYVEDKSSGQGFNPELYHLQLPYDGEYRIEVRPEALYQQFNDIAPDFTLTLTEIEYPTLALDTEQLLKSVNDVTGQTLVFMGQAGQTFELEVKDEYPNAATQIVIKQGTTALITHPIPRLTSAEEDTKFDETIVFTVPADGEVRVIITEYPQPDDWLANLLSLTLRLD